MRNICLCVINLGGVLLISRHAPRWLFYRKMFYLVSLPEMSSSVHIFLYLIVIKDSTFSNRRKNAKIHAKMARHQVSLWILRLPGGDLATVCGPDSAYQCQGRLIWGKEVTAAVSALRPSDGHWLRDEWPQNWQFPQFEESGLGLAMKFAMATDT